MAPQTHHRQERNLSCLIFLFLYRLLSSAPPETWFWQDVTLREWEVAACELIFSTKRWWRSNGVFFPDKTTRPLLFFCCCCSQESSRTRSHLALRKIGFFCFFPFCSRRETGHTAVPVKCIDCKVFCWIQIFSFHFSSFFTEISCQTCHCRDSYYHYACV